MWPKSVNMLTFKHQRIKLVLKHATRLGFHILYNLTAKTRYYKEGCRFAPEILRLLSNKLFSRGLSVAAIHMCEVENYIKWAEHDSLKSDSQANTHSLILFLISAIPTSINSLNKKQCGREKINTATWNIV